MARQQRPSWKGAASLMQIRSRRSFALAALVLLSSAPAATAAVPGAVSVRVEGQTQTRVPATRIETSATPITVRDAQGDEGTCSGTSALAALNTAVAGNWSGDVHPSFGPGVDTVAGESHPVAAGERYWNFWINEEPADLGACGQELNPGDRVLFFVTCVSATSGCANGALISSVPATARPGQQVALLVEQATAGYDADWNPTFARGRAENAVVTIDGASTATNAAGNTTVTLGDARGPRRIVIEKAGFARFSTSICVSDGTDGECGNVKSIPGTTTGGDDSGCVHVRNDGRCGTTDQTPPSVKLEGLVHGKRYARSQAPRELAGVAANFPAGQRVADASGLRDIRVRITRYSGKRCWSLNATKERFTKMRSCKRGKGQFFSVGKTVDWSYQLPIRLGKGKYRVEAHAIDGKGNTDRKPRTGSSHFVFSVR